MSRVVVPVVVEEVKVQSSGYLKIASEEGATQAHAEEVIRRSDHTLIAVQLINR